jgi:hypothetical protein
VPPRKISDARDVVMGRRMGWEAMRKGKGSPSNANVNVRPFRPGRSDLAGGRTHLAKVRRIETSIC